MHSSISTVNGGGSSQFARYAGVIFHSSLAVNDYSAVSWYGRIQGKLRASERNLISFGIFVKVERMKEGQLANLQAHKIFYLTHQRTQA